MKKQLNQEHLVGAACLFVAIVVLFITPSFPKGQENISISGPAFFPNLLACILLLCGVYEIIAGFLNEEGRIELHSAKIVESLKSSQFVSVLLIIILLGVFILFFERLGFILCTFIFLFTLLYRLKVPVVKNLLYTVAFILFIYLIFGRLFSISLPAGVLEYIGLS